MNDLPRIQALRCFITVAREGTVSRAATLLHLTQPAVSLQLKGLEESTGLQLFNRTPGGFTLTEAGAALLPLAHRTISASADFRTAADSLRESLRATLRVGTILDPESIRLGPFVRSLATSSKKTEVFLRYGMSDDVLAQIGRGELDVGYYIDATPPECLASGTAARTHHRGWQVPAHGTDALRLPRDRAARMERQGDGKGLGRPHRPALDHDAACTRRIGG